MGTGENPKGLEDFIYEKVGNFRYLGATVKLKMTSKSMITMIKGINI